MSARATAADLLRPACGERAEVRGLRIARCWPAAVAAALLVSGLGQGARAQSLEDRGGFALRQASLSTGYAFVDLPPITLGGVVPNEVLEEDLLTSGTVAIDGWKVTNRTRYTLNAFGIYSTRARRAQLSAPGGDISFGLSHAVGNKWRFDVGSATSITSANRWAFQDSQARQSVEGASSFDDLAGRTGFPRSQHPDPREAVLFIPVGQSFTAGDLHGERSIASSVQANATYTSSPRFSAFFRGGGSTVRRISSNRDLDTAFPSVDATNERAGFGFNYARSERSQLSFSVDWTQTSGITADQLVSATVGYGWTGRKWFMMATLGAGARPFDTTIGGDYAAVVSSKPAFTYSGAIGYKFGTQTLLVQYDRAASDNFGHGGRNVVTGFEGHVETIGGSWAWQPPRGRWTTQANLSLVRRPGNFSYINAWLGTVGMGRQVSPNLRLMGEFLFDRHGSRAFEGFHLTRQAVRLNVVWTRPRRPVE